MVFIYALKLENSKYYIGKTTNPKIRLDNHFDLNGSKWTQKYTPLNIQEIIPDCEDFDEDKYTLKYMNKYGIDNVRGGSFCELKLTSESKKMINKMINSSTDKCKLCGQKGHFANECNNKNNSYDCPNKSNPYHKCNEYCNEKYKQESNLQSEDDNDGSEDDSDGSEDDNFDNLKFEFLKSCKRIDKQKTGYIVVDNILKVLKKIEPEAFNDYNSNNILSICFKINCCDLDEISVGLDYCNFKFLDKGIEYKNFIDGLIYIIRNKPTFCNKCDYEKTICTCRKYKKNNASTCYRCGRKGHFSDNCYASKHVKGYYLS